MFDVLGQLPYSANAQMWYRFPFQMYFNIVYLKYFLYCVFLMQRKIVANKLDATTLKW